MAHRNLANGAEQRAKAKRVFFGVPAISYFDRVACGLRFLALM